MLKIVNFVSVRYRVIFMWLYNTDKIAAAPCFKDCTIGGIGPDSSSRTSLFSPQKFFVVVNTVTKCGFTERNYTGWHLRTCVERMGVGEGP